MTTADELRELADELTANAMAAQMLLPGDMRELAQRMRHLAREIEAEQQPVRPTRRFLRVVDDADG